MLHHLTISFVFFCCFPLHFPPLIPSFPPFVPFIFPVVSFSNNPCCAFAGVAVSHAQQQLQHSFHDPHVVCLHHGRPVSSFTQVCTGMFHCAATQAWDLTLCPKAYIELAQQ